MNVWNMKMSLLVHNELKCAQGFFIYKPLQSDNFCLQVEACLRFYSTNASTWNIQDLKPNSEKNLVPKRHDDFFFQKPSCSRSRLIYLHVDIRSDPGPIISEW